MCLLFIVPARAEREAVSDEWLADIYKRNHDGFGFMWHTKTGGNHHYKALGNAAAFTAAYRQMERHANPFAVHVRMATHGDIDQSQSHPYPVDDQNELWLMHNGILSSGNYNDKAKSDTWHYINDTLRPMYSACGNGLFVSQLLEMMGEAIGNNRFVMMDKAGEFHIVNKDQGLHWKGMWLSNTYAWSAAKYGAIKPLPRSNYGAWNAGSLVSNPVKGSRVTTAESTLERASDWLDELAETAMVEVTKQVRAWQVAKLVRNEPEAWDMLEDILFLADDRVLTIEETVAYLKTGTAGPEMAGVIMDALDWYTDQEEAEAEDGGFIDPWERSMGGGIGELDFGDSRLAAEWDIPRGRAYAEEEV